MKLSAFGARILSESNYEFPVQVNWIGEANEDLVRNDLSEAFASQPLKQIGNINPYGLPSRLWEFLLKKIEITSTNPAGQLAKKDFNRLINVLLNDVYQAKGKTTFKEEFVTAGGINLAEVDFKTMESRVCPGLYFAGEVLDIDGVTGGFNFQAAWTTGWIAGKGKQQS